MSQETRNTPSTKLKKILNFTWRLLQQIPLLLTLSLPVSISVSFSHSVCLTLGALNMQITSFLIKITVQCFWFLARFENTFLADFGLSKHIHTHTPVHTHALTKRALFAGLLWALALGSISANIAAAALCSPSPFPPPSSWPTHTICR